MEALCKYNYLLYTKQGTNHNEVNRKYWGRNPYWCSVIWGYCQFQTQDTINERCPIYQGYPKWVIVIDDDDITDEIIQKYSYATIYDSQDHLVSIGDTAFQGYKENLSINCAYVRFIGKTAFQDCVRLNTLDFSSKTDDSIPVLSSPSAFMKSNTEDFVNDTFKIIVPQRLYNSWVSAPNWVALINHIQGV